MATKTKERLIMPEFSYKGFNIPPLIFPAEELITGLHGEEPARELASKSAPLVWRVGLYTVGRDLAFGGKDAKALPEPVRQAGARVYRDCQAKRGRGAYHKDAILFEPRTTIKGSRRPGNDYVAARSFREIRGFKRENGKWDIVPSPETKESRVWVPPGERYIVPGKFHPAYDPETGLPIETIGGREDAIRRWKESGLTRAQADGELSTFCRKGSGLYAVSSWSGGDSGAMAIGLYQGPGEKTGLLVGLFPLSRYTE